jgi:hypothetical protein
MLFRINDNPKINTSISNVKIEDCIYPVDNNMYNLIHFFKQNNFDFIVTKNNTHIVITNIYIK